MQLYTVKYKIPSANRAERPVRLRLAAETGTTSGEMGSEVVDLGVPARLLRLRIPRPTLVNVSVPVDEVGRFGVVRATDERTPEKVGSSLLGFFAS